MVQQDIREELIRNQIPEQAIVHVSQGKDFDFSSVKISDTIPQTRNFRVFQYKNPHTMRLVKILKCDFAGCSLFFRKWHNFFDHLRVHTGERPFVCTFAGCTQTFTQKANLNKHLITHQKRNFLNCEFCPKTFHNINLYQVKSRRTSF